MKKIELEEKRERKKRFTLLTALIIGMLFLLAFAQLLLSNHLASFGKELVALRNVEKALTVDNERLEKDIAKESSIATISQKAHELSFSSASLFFVVEAQESVAALLSNGF